MIVDLVSLSLVASIRLLLWSKEVTMAKDKSISRLCVLMRYHHRPRKTHTQQHKVERKGVQFSAIDTQTHNL